MHNAFCAWDPQDCLTTLVRRLLDRRAARDHWDGYLASSALSTGTAVLALYLANQRASQPTHRAEELIAKGAGWLIDHQNADGGWGDTTCSRSNISTTAIVWATLSMVAAHAEAIQPVLQRAAAWLRDAAGETTPEALREAILRRYGKDRTFSVPILTVLALTGKLGPDRSAAWRTVPQLPFELAALPHAWFQRLRLPVVSYALPALIAIGQVRHRFAPSRNPVTRGLRNHVRARTLDVLRDMQPDSGGYLEATPLTSFVVMSLASAGHADNPVAHAGVRFLVESARPDGSWPIDTNLATWVTTLAIGALGQHDALSPDERRAMRRWLLDQQSAREHPFTHAAAGAWAWTPLSGGVPDADDTAGALVALRLLGDPDAEVISAAEAGARWLLGVQNRDGGIPTFCRGWGALPFDRSTPEITAHAVRAWSCWNTHLERSLQREVRRAADSAITFLAASQRPDGSWVPLWFGNEHASGEENPVYGTARVLLGLDAALVRADSRVAESRARAVRWLLGVQNDDGGWGGDRAVLSSIEETGVVLSALRRRSCSDADGVRDAINRGVEWLTTALAHPHNSPSPLGLYFARLWYYEELYPLVFAVEGLTANA